MKSLLRRLAPLLLLVLASCGGRQPAFARGFVRYTHVQAYANVSSSAVSRFVSVDIHLRNLAGIATSCLVGAGGQKRITGLSAYGEAEVSFNGISNFKGYTVVCEVN